MLRVDRYVFSSPKLQKRHRFVFLSDMHECVFGQDNALLLEKIRAEKPDFVLIGGDMIFCQGVKGEGRHCRAFPSAFVHGLYAFFRCFFYLCRGQKPPQGEDSVLLENRVEQTARLLNALKRDYPVYLALGNHEQRFQRMLAGMRGVEGAEAAAARVLREQLRAAVSGCTVLDRESVCPEGALGDLMISGVSLPERYYRPLFLKRKPPLGTAAYRHYAGLSKMEKKVCKIEIGGKRAEGHPGQRSERYCISLLHSPMYHKEAIRAGADLVLSGHVHGGTIRLPFLGALMTPQYRFFYKECAGVFPYKGGYMLVNRGLGTHSINIRINDFPEISVVDLLPGDN